MKYKILPTREFEKDFSKLGDILKKRIKEKIKEVAIEPSRYKRLHYVLSGSLRVRIGKIRVIFSYDSEKLELYLEKIVIGHKYNK